MTCISGAAGHLATNPCLNRGLMDAILEFYTSKTHYTDSVCRCKSLDHF